MSGQDRTFVLQVVGVTMLVVVIYFAFLRPSDPGELAGIDAPGDNAPPFALPGSDGDGRDGREGRQGSNRSVAGSEAGGTFVTRRGSIRSLSVPPTGDGPRDDQYTSTVTALMERLKADLPGGAR